MGNNTNMNLTNINQTNANLTNTNNTQTNTTINENAITLSPDATLGDKIHAVRISLNMSVAELSRRTGLTARAIRYYENNERVPSVEVIQKMADVFNLSTNFFMDPAAYQQQLEKEAFLEEAQKKYGSKGKAQAKRLTEEVRALYAGGELSENDKQGFMEEMMDIFMIAKEEAKIYTPKKYLKDNKD